MPSLRWYDNPMRITQALRRLGVTAVVIATTACQVISPPPTLALHASTEPAPIDSTSAMLIVGGMGQLLGGDGWGLALRVEHQTSDALTLGVDLTGGVGHEDNHRDEQTGRPKHWLLSLRSYGRYATHAHEWVAGTGGLAVSVMDTGLIAVAPHLGVAVAYPNDYAVPTFQLSGAVSVPLRRGAAFSDMDIGDDGQEHGKRPGTNWYWLTDIGVLFPIGDTNNALSLNLGAAAGYGAEKGFIVAPSIADQQRWR